MNIKTILLSVLSLGCTYITTGAAKTFTLSFEKSDYTFSVDNGTLSICPVKKGLFITENPSLPALPYSPICIIQPADCTTESYNISVKKEVLLSEINIEAGSPAISTDTNIEAVQRIAYASYESPVIYSDNRTLEGYHYFYMEITPFFYDIKTKCLFFISEMTVSLTQRESSGEKANWNSSAADDVREMVINPDDLSHFYPITNNTSIQQEQRGQKHVDYLIVTTQSLSGYFAPLVSWKTKKGLRTEIITLEEICANYSYPTVPFSIKHCLYDYYTNYGLKWVLLGGNANKVPSLMCRIKDYSGSTGLSNFITTPTDLFYACFGGNFNWDGNNNGIYGEIADNISLYPNIYVSRVPVRWSSDVTHFINKVIAYETQPSYNPAIEKMLFAAGDMNYTGSGKSVFQRHSEKLFNDYVSPNWNGTTDFLYDNECTIPSISYLNPSGLFNALQSNYHFADIFTHGLYNCFQMYDRDTSSTNNYTTIYAGYQTNSIPTIITTLSCYANEFDKDYCMSSAFLCGEHGGLAFFGSSRKSYYVTNNIYVSYSLLYNANFYSNLLTGSPSQAPYHFASVAAKAKSSLINMCGTDSLYRWLQFSINPMGDPELPIYTSIPYSFSNASIVGNGTNITVNTGGVSGCTIALTSVDNGASFFEKAENVSSYLFNNVSSPFIVTISKHNYVTFVSDTLYTTSITINGNQTICGSETYSIDYTVPGGINQGWSLNKSHSSFDFSNISQTHCTISASPNIFADAILSKVLSKGNYYTSTIASKQIVTYGPLTMSCSQESGSYMGNTYSSRDNIVYSADKGFVVNPTCSITLESPNLNYMTISHQGASPTSFSYQGNDQVTFTLPYQSQEYQYYLCGSSDNDCNDFSIKFTVCPTQTNNLNLNLWLNRTNTSLDVAIGYFSPLDSTTPLYLHNNWSLWVYKADSGTTIFNGTVNGLKTFNTTSWTSGIYIIRGVADGQTFVRQLLY